MLYKVYTNQLKVNDFLILSIFLALKANLMFLEQEAHA